MLHQLDLYLYHSFKVWGSQRVNVGLNIQNLFDQDIVSRRFTQPYRDSFNVSDTTFFSGTFDPTALATAAPTTYRPNAQFGLPDQYQERRQMRFNVHWTF